LADKRNFDKKVSHSISKISCSQPFSTEVQRGERNAFVVSLRDLGKTTANLQICVKPGFTLCGLQSDGRSCAAFLESFRPIRSQCRRTDETYKLLTRLSKSRTLSRCDFVVALDYNV